MAQLDGQRKFKWASPTSYAIAHNQWRADNIKATRRAMVEIAERNEAGEIVDPYLISEFQVASQSSFELTGNEEELLPVVGRMPHVRKQVDMTDDAWPEAWTVNPWLIASAVECVRDNRNRYLFHINSEWQTPGGIDWVEHYDTGIVRQGYVPLPEKVYDPLDLANSYPYIRKAIFEDHYKVVPVEAPTSVGQVEEFRNTLPTGNRFAEPFMRRHPVKVFVQLQYEAFTFPGDIEDVVEERLFTVCSTSFNGYKPDPSAPDAGARQQGDIWKDPPRWMITAIEYERFYIPIDNAGKVDFVDGYLMQYRLESTKADGGWLDRRELVDKYFLTQPNDLSTITPNRDAQDRTHLIDCLLNTDGTRIADASQGGEPLYKDHVEQPLLAWTETDPPTGAGFLRDD